MQGWPVITVSAAGCPNRRRTAGQVQHACHSPHDQVHLDIASSAVHHGKVLLEVGVGYFGEVLLQLSHDLALGGRIERVAKFIKNMHRRDEHEAVELIMAYLPR
jgi:hypothetical protein